MTALEDEAPAGRRQTLSCNEIPAHNEGATTILFIHGAHSSGAEWTTLVEAFKDKYHVLLPDLPAHGQSKNVVPFTRDLSTRLLAELIRERASAGKAHVVGHSLGAKIAIELAVNYSDLVDVVFVSGYGAGSSPKALAYGLWIQNQVVKLIPSPVTRWLMDGTEIPPSPNTSLELSKDIANAICFGDDGWPGPWNARTLIIAAGKSGILPTADSFEAARGLRDIGRQGNAATVAFTHPDMRHPWSLQDPELYAETVREWIEECTVHEGFKPL